MASIVVSIEPTDGQAPLGARTSQDRVDTKIVSIQVPNQHPKSVLGWDKISVHLRKNFQKYF